MVTMVKPNETPRAFSYLRFSTPEQSKGDSKRRQTALAEQWCAQHGVELDTKLTFHDLGVSAFRGMNAEVGKLGEFLEAVKVGLVPQGSFFLVESLDRVSRKTARKALRTLEDIVETGVSVVTLSDGKVYSAETLDTDPTSLLMSILIFMRSHEESETKSRRLLSAWKNKKHLASTEGKPLTSRCPAWLRLNKERGRYELIPEKAKVVRWIFKKTKQGVGRSTICKELNQDHVPVFGNGGAREGARWYESYIHKILTNPSVYGTFIPHEMVHAPNGKKSRRPLEPILSYFPPVVTEEDFQEVALLLQSKNPQRGKHAAKGPASVLAGLMRCPRCGSVMTRVYKGKAGGPPQLVCTKAKDGAGCKYRGVRVDRVEAAIFRSLPKLLTSPPVTNGNDDQEIERTVTSIDAMEEGLSILLDDFAKTGSQAVRAKVTEYEEKISESRKRLEDLREWHAVNVGPLLERSLRECAEKLQAEPRDIAGTNVTLRKLFSGIVVDYTTGTLVLRWKNGQESGVFYEFPKEG